MDDYRALAPDAREMQEYDEHTIKLGTSSLILMERAGKLAAEKILDNSAVTLGKEIIILCGPGNNGGDGLVIARSFIRAGIPPNVLICGARNFSPEFDKNLRRLSGYQKLYLYDPESLTSVDFQFTSISSERLAIMISKSKLIVDCLLGNGQSGSPRGTIAILLEVLEASLTDSYVVAMDVPTGVNSSSGEVYAQALKADETFAIQFVKRGLLQYPARQKSGKITILNIGISPSQVSKFSVLSECSLAPITRKRDGHKMNSGSVLVLGGSSEMPGAPILAARAALVAGAGVVRLASPVQSYNIPEEVMRLALTEKNAFTKEHLPQIEDACKRASVVLVGPGIGLSTSVRQFVLEVLKSLSIPVVLDADALTILAEQTAQGRVTTSENWVLTPHPGEFSRMSGQSIAEIQKDRYRAFLNFTQKCRAVLVLKGAGSLVGDITGGWIQTEGNPYMATAGSGDVLAGIVAGFIAQGLSLLEAAKAAVYVHGRAGDSSYIEKGSIIASDIIDAIPAVVRPLRLEVS